MKHYICAMILIVYLPGCTSSDMVSSNPRIGSLSYSQLNENSANESATIVFKNGQSNLAKIVQIRPDSTFLVLDKSEFRKGLLTSEIHEISTKNHVTGAFEGLGLGSLVGVATVVIDLGFFSRADAGATILLGLAGVAMVPIGVIAGATSGHTSKYYFPDYSLDSTSNQPSGRKEK